MAWHRDFLRVTRIDLRRKLPGVGVLMTLVGQATVTREESPARAVGLRSRAFVKRLLDLVLAILGLIALSPLLVVISVAIRLDTPGPAFFRQVRVGRNGQPFLIIKFRTLRIEGADPTGLALVAEGDGRLTGLGHFLRRTSLDELPQLLNVVMGDMALVGPRPHVPGMLVCGEPYEVVVPDYTRRHAVRPGLTGWAQIAGLRGPVTDVAHARARIEHDLAYIRSQSLALDLKIIGLTVWREVILRIVRR